MGLMVCLKIKNLNSIPFSIRNLPIWICLRVPFKKYHRFQIKWMKEWEIENSSSANPYSMSSLNFVQYGDLILPANQKKLDDLTVFHPGSMS